MIGYYIHHHGIGHRTRAASIAAELGQPVVGLSSLPPPGGASPYDDWVPLARDDTAADAEDPTARGALHWAPRGDAGLRDRMSAIAAWVDRHHPAAVVVDVSVEVAVMLRLLGVPVVVVAMPGDRADPAHQLAYRLADAVLAFWTQDVYDPPWLVTHRDRTHFLGACSRFDGRPRPIRASGPRPTGVLLCGTGGGSITAAERAVLPTEWEWQLLGGDGTAAVDNWVDDPWPALCAADVVITHAGQNALAEVAAAGRPAVVVPQPRPHHEQRRTAEALAAAGVVHTVPAWPDPADWPAALGRACALGGSGWARWRPGNAAARAVEVITAVSAAGRRTRR